MIRPVRIALLLSALLTATSALAQTATPAKPLLFSDIGRVKSWKPGGARLIYIKDGSDQWYRVELLEPCMDLYPDQDPTFITSTSLQTQEKYNAVDLARHSCTVTKLEKMNGLPPAQPYTPPPAKTAAKK